jgi:deoxycytidylate deaminase
MSAIPFAEHAKKETARPGVKVDSTSEVRANLTPEIVIALCGPIGSPLHVTATNIDNALREYGYTTETVRLSNMIRDNANVVSRAIDVTSKLTEIESLIQTGDDLRDRFGADILAKLGIAKISADRKKKHGEFVDKAAEHAASSEAKIVSHRVCHVIDSIKNKAELDLLRLVYGDALFAVGVFSPLEVRRKNLQQPGELSAEDVERLIDTDSGEEISHGQSVRDTFPRCDYFLRVDYVNAPPTDDEVKAQIVKKLSRFFGLVFRSVVATPTAEETAMYASASAARNSACISRQVGAAVTSRTGEVLAVGWNDVPRFGGGLYGKPPLDPQVGETPDERCFAQEGAKCHNDAEKKLVSELIVDGLVTKGIVASDRRNDAVAAIREDSRVKDLIEFSRAVHAEMHAILGACRVAGDRVVGGKLFVTTYPCHSCARHIVASGISEIYFIEPYRKSLATKLHTDALTESIPAGAKVRLLQFDGVAPRRFLDVFEAGDRKKNGVLDLHLKTDAKPANQVSLRAIPRMEQAIVAELANEPLSFPRLMNEGTSNGNDTNQTPKPPAPNHPGGRPNPTAAA